MSNKDNIIIFDDIDLNLGNDSTAQDMTSTYSLGSDTLTISGIDSIDLSGIDTSNYYSPGATVGGITASTNWNSGNAYTINTGMNNYTYSTVGISPTTVSTVNITDTGVEMAEGTDIKIGGQSLKEFMKKMEQRLSILTPDPAKLEKFEALKKAYEHYKTMESLCFDEPSEESKQ